MATMMAIALYLAGSTLAGLLAWSIAIRRGSRNNLPELTENLERSLATAGVGSFVGYPSRGVLHCSPAILEALGLAVKDGIIGLEQWLSVIDTQEERQRVLAQVNEAVRNLATFTLDYRIRIGEQSPRWLRTYGQAVLNRKGERVVYGAFLDITALKALELDVLARDARLRDASLAARFYMWELDLERMRYTLDRPTAGGSRHGANNETFSYSVDVSRQMHHPEERPIFDSMITRIRTEDVPYEIEARVMHPDGTFHWMLAVGKLVKDDGPRRVRGIIQDIDARKQAALRLQAVEARLDRAMRGTNDGIWEVVCDSKQLWVSPRFAEMLGYQQADLLGSHQLLLDITHPDDRSVIENWLLGRFETTDQVDIDVRMRNRAGAYRVMRVRGLCEKNHEGLPVTITGTQRDVTDQFEYQEALIRATKAADAASKAKSEFLANMSHEIRTPMNGVLGMTGVLLETGLTPEQREYASTVRDSASALLTIINDILDFSKVEAGKLDLECIDLRIRDCLEDATRLLALQAGQKGLEVMLFVDPTVPDLVRGDPGRLRQILLNLGGNAVKFTERGEVSISVRMIAENETGVHLRFEVRDSGVGIPADRIDFLFEAFSQVDASTTRKFGGTGLGLSIVKRLVELMGGETGVSSVPGTGSTFWFALHLPRAKALAPDEKAVDLELAGRRVLVVDDNRTSLRALLALLESLGADASGARSGHEALLEMQDAFTQGQPYEVALIDQRMPDYDGEALGRSIRDDANLRATRTVLLAAAGEPVELEPCRQQGFADRLVKPVMRAELTHCLLAAPGAARPAASAPASVTRGVDVSAAGPGVRRLLLAEDNVVNQKVACHLLRKLGHEVDVVSDGQQAVSAWQSGLYGLILMDCQMPVLDGYQATRQIRSLEGATRRIPIIALTAHAMKGAAEECLRAGMDEHLTKPIDRDLLTACLARHFEVGASEPVPSRRLAQY